MAVATLVALLAAFPAVPPVPEPPVVPEGSHGGVHGARVGGGSGSLGVSAVVGGLELASVGFGLEALLQGAALSGDPLAGSVASEADVLGWAGLSVATGGLLGLDREVVDGYAAVFASGLVYGAYVSFVQSTFCRYLLGEDVGPVVRAFYEATGPSQAPWLLAEVGEGLGLGEAARVLGAVGSVVGSFLVSSAVLAGSVGVGGAPDLGSVASDLVGEFGPLGLLALPFVWASEAAVWLVTSSLEALGEALLFTWWTGVVCGRSLLEAWVAFHPGVFRRLGRGLVGVALGLGDATLCAFRI